MLVIEQVQESFVISQEWVQAGKAIFTVKVPESFVQQHGCKPHYTYRVTHKEANGQWNEAWFVSLLTGQDNENDYTYIGMLNSVFGGVRHTAKSGVREDSWAFRIVNRVIAAIWQDRLEEVTDAGWEINHTGCCGRCGHTLTTPQSVKSGYGPECIKKIVEERF